MIPDEFTGYFAAAAAAAGVLIGLMSVAVSLRPETVFGDRAIVRGRAQPGLVAGPGPAPGRASCGWAVTCRQ